MRRLLGFFLVVATSSIPVAACSGESPDPSEGAGSTASALSTTIAGTSFKTITGNQTNTSILGVPVRAFLTNGEAEAVVNLPFGYRHVMLDFAVTECHGGQMVPTVSFVGVNANHHDAGISGPFTPNSRASLLAYEGDIPAGQQRIRISARGDAYVPNVCDANLYVFGVTILP